jgi:16S rRNA (uracil1498-N3)-methyltransferase
MLLIRAPHCTLTEDPDVGLVGHAAVEVADVDRLQQQYAAVIPHLGAALPKVGLLGGPIGSGRLAVIEASSPPTVADHSTTPGSGGASPASGLDPATAAAAPAAMAEISREPQSGHPAVVRSEGALEGTATATATAPTSSVAHPPTMNAEIVLFRNPPPPASITLILGLCRIKVLARVLETATAMGIKTFHVIDTKRTEPAYWTSHSTDRDFINARLVAGLEQAVDTVLPVVHVWRDTDAFFRDHLPAIADGALNLVAHPSPTAHQCPTAVTTRCNLAVGPEGGFVDAEVERLCELKFQMLSLGPRILPVETAVHVLLGKLCF